jgi:hypothetical protein
MIRSPMDEEVKIGIFLKKFAKRIKAESFFCVIVKNNDIMIQTDLEPIEQEILVQELAMIFEEE